VGNDSRNSSDQKKFLDLLDTHLSHGFRAYHEYLNNNKKFLYARIIKKNNERLVGLILEHAHLFPLDQRGDLLSILFHIDSWLVQWNSLNESRDFKLEDEFIFHTIKKFPRDSLERLDTYFHENFYQNFKN
jgi:hypothetical protein